MSVNKEAVMFNIKQIVDKIHGDGYGGAFNHKTVNAPIKSVPDYYKILYRNISIDINEIGNVFAYYHFEINTSFQIFLTNGGGHLLSYDRDKLLSLAEKSRELIDMLNLIGYPVQLIKYSDEMKRIKRIRSRKLKIHICKYEPIFGMSEDSQIVETKNIEKLKQESAKEQPQKRKDKISNSDFSGAISNAPLDSDFFSPKLISRLPNDMKPLLDDFNFNFSHNRVYACMLILRRILPLSIVKKFQETGQEETIKKGRDHLDTMPLLEKAENLITKRRYKEIISYKKFLDASQHSYTFSPEISDVLQVATTLRLILDEFFPDKNTK